CSTKPNLALISLLKPSLSLSGLGLTSKCQRNGRCSLSCKVNSDCITNQCSTESLSSCVFHRSSDQYATALVTQVHFMVFICSYSIHTTPINTHCPRHTHTTQ